MLALQNPFTAELSAKKSKHLDIIFNFIFQSVRYIKKRFKD